jgi:hypothetical protein
MSDVFVTPPPSLGLATSGTTAAGPSSGVRTLTPPCATLRTSSTLIPLLSDAGLDLDFLQINCGKRISAMALLETNVKNRIALIQEPYTSINGCTLIHKRDFFSSGSAPPSPTPGGAAPTTSWTSLRPCAAIYAPGRSDVLPVYRFMTRNIATVAVPLGFISSIYMDITKNMRSKELLALLDFCRQENKTLIMAIDSNSHSYLFSYCENNRRLEIESLVAEYGLEVHNRGITPTFAGAGLNNTVNYSIFDITLSLNLPRLYKIKDWKVSDVPSGSDHRNITFGYVAGAPPKYLARIVPCDHGEQTLPRQYSH